MSIKYDVSDVSGISINSGVSAGSGVSSGVAGASITGTNNLRDKSGINGSSVVLG